MSGSVILSSDDQDTSSGDEDTFEESVSDLEDVSNLISSEDTGNMAKIELNGMCTFDAHGESMKTHQAWKRWLRSFELFSLGKGVTDVDQKRALLLHCAGQDVQDIFFTLPEGDGDNAYEKTTAALEKHFKSKINVPYERYAFRSMKQEENETVEQFVTKLRQQSVLCEFDKPDEQIRDQVIEKCRSHKLRQRLLEKGHELTLDQLRMMASTLEQAETQAKKMESHQGTLNRVSLSSHGAAKQGHAKRTHEHKPKTEMKCYRCDREGHLSRDPQCPAKTKRCNECGKVGHFAKCCKSKLPGSSQKRGSSYSQRNNGPRKGNVRAVEPEQNNYAFNVSQRSRSEKFRLQVDKQDVDFIVDSGATVNIIDRKLWEQLKQNHITCKSEKTDTRLFTYGSDTPLKLIGKFQTRVHVPNTDHKSEAEIYVMDGSGPALLGRDTAMELGMLRIGVNSVNVVTDDLLDKYSACFNGIGKLKDYQLKLHIDETVRPVAQHMYRVPYSLRAKVSDKIDELETLDIIEKVEKPTPWVSPCIVVPKPDGDIRICVDMRQANRAIIRERHPIPTVDEIMYNMNGSKVFSKLDLKYGYHQIELDENSRDITTFVTHKGLYRYKRLMFGINSAPEKYQQVISQVFHDCEGVQNISDDIVVHAGTKEEHDRRLAKVFDRILENNLTLNRRKCQLGMNQIQFMGHMVSMDGIGPTADRVKGIIEAKPPTSGAEIRSFLGLVNFSARYIPDLATVSEPLRKLARKGAVFCWGKEQQASFDKLKESLSRTETLGHFKLDASKTTVVTDASNVGLGAVLIQSNDGNSQVISYASKALTDVEKRYSTTEKEALAVVWACEKFRLYLQGVAFELVTDHKPLEVLYGPRSKPNARIERWIMKLMPYNFKVVYAPGKTNIADALSRLVNPALKVSPTPSQLESETEEFVRFTAREATPIALSTREVEEMSKVDQELSDVRVCLMSRRWDKSCPMYYPVREELSQIGYLVLRGTRLVIPTALRSKCVELAHQGHLGIVGTKQQLRTKVWWPRMDKDVENYVKACHGCQIVDSSTHTEPVTPTPLPIGPWQDLAIDLMGPLPTGHYVFVVVDYYSRYYELEITKDTSTGKLIDVLETMFSRYGLPCSVTSDNGPQFKSDMFREYMEENAIHHRRVTPLHPAANGEVERQNRSLLKRIKIAHAESKDWKNELRTYLLAYRTTPHATTGVSPAELMWGRKLRTKLPQVEQLERRVDESVRDRDSEMKHRNKLYIDQKRGAVESALEAGDTVLVKQKRQDKFSTPYNPNPFKLVEKIGNSCTVESPQGIRYKRNSSFVKPYNTPRKQVETQPRIMDANESPIVESTSVDISASDADVSTGTKEATDPPCVMSPRPIRQKMRPKKFDDYVTD